MATPSLSTMERILHLMAEKKASDVFLSPRALLGTAQSNHLLG